MIDHGTLEITTTIGCRVNCRFCPQGKLTRGYIGSSNEQTMDLSTFIECIERLPPEVRIDFSGMAEPWLNEHCTDMLLYAARRGHLIAVYTTLVGMTASDFERIKEVDFDYFVLHLPDSEGNTVIPITPDYLRLLERILNTDLHVQSERQISCHGTLRSDVAALLNDRFPVFSTMIDRAGNLNEGLSVPRRLTGPLMCSRATRLNNHNVLLPDGRVLLCCMDYGMKHVLGNLRECSYDELLHGAEANRVRAGMDDESQALLCRNCTAAVRYQAE